MPRTLLLLVCLAVACDGRISDDPTLYLTGTEEAPLMGANGAPTCASPKVLVCHIPPGNPANAHTICIAQAAVGAHRKHHGDTIGPCGGADGGNAGGGGGGAQTGDGGTVPTCRNANSACTADGDCCAGMRCVDRICTPIIP